METLHVRRPLEASQRRWLEGFPTHRSGGAVGLRTIIRVSTHFEDLCKMGIEVKGQFDFFNSLQSMM